MSLLVAYYSSNNLRRGTHNLNPGSSKLNSGGICAKGGKMENVKFHRKSTWWMECLFEAAICGVPYGSGLHRRDFVVTGSGKWNGRWNDSAGSQSMAFIWDNWNPVLRNSDTSIVDHLVVMYQASGYSQTIATSSLATGAPGDAMTISSYKPPCTCGAIVSMCDLVTSWTHTHFPPGVPR